MNTWRGFEAAKPAPWQSRGLHHLVNSLSPKMSELVEDAVASCWGDIWGLSGMSSRNLSSSSWNISVLTLSMFLRYFGNELYNRGPNTVIAFS